MTPDVCVVVEGAYPYVTGGVSAWLHNLITHLPELTFGVVHLGSKPERGRTPKYRLPPNVIDFREIFLNSLDAGRGRSRSRSSSDIWRKLRAFHDALHRQRWDEGIEILQTAVTAGNDHATPAYLLFSHEAWELLVSLYRTQPAASSFLSYFWTFRSTHLPLFALNSASLPHAHLYHAVSTGYAGYAASLAKLKTGSPLVLTEHGIYTRERDMEITLSAWLEDSPDRSLGADSEARIFQPWWTGMFRFMSRFTYHMADSIISITAANQQYQLRDGAARSKMRIIPNGVAVERFAALFEERQSRADDAFTVGFVGRVVPIKDVRCFIQAVKMASTCIPRIKALIIGPTDEDPDYYAECRELAARLGLSKIVRFTGPGDVLEHYRTMDVLALTSLSEGQPLVILEANGAGIPVVATDVGACRELLEGVSAEDRDIGPSGLLTLPASPHETAEAIIHLASDQSLRERLASAGHQRVMRFYRQDAVIAAYRDLYQSYVAATAQRAGSWPESG